jgi:hypothetical protein
MSYSGQSHQVEDTCPCCNLSKTTYETEYWDGTLGRLESAAQNGCLRCGFLANCIACWASGAIKEFITLRFDERNRFRVWENFELCELILHGDKQPVSLHLDIFSLLGE